MGIIGRSSDIFSDLIRKNSHCKGDYLLRDEIVQLFLDDPAGHQLTRDALSKGNGKGTEVAIAGNWFDWFSMKITDGSSEYAGQFERTKIMGKWAYRVAC